MVHADAVARGVTGRDDGDVVDVSDRWHHAAPDAAEAPAAQVVQEGCRTRLQVPRVEAIDADDDRGSGHNAAGEDLTLSGDRPGKQV